MTSVRLFKSGAEAFPAMFSAIQRAAHSIALEMYIIADDETGREFRDQLTAAAKRGIQVQVLIDAWGSWDLPDAFWGPLRAADGTVRWFRPLAQGMLSFRNHRKLLLIDDQIAYIGGMNIADEYYRGATGEAPWRDNMLEFSGAEAAWLRQSFARSWARTGSSLRRLLFQRQRNLGPASRGRVRFLESGPDKALRSVRGAYRQVIRSSVASIDLAMSYFYPHGTMLRALKRAVRRGVRVRLLFPRQSDVPIARWAARGLYGWLLRTGAEVWEYTPAMLHAKMTIADDTVIAGSANLDIRSGRINEELVAIVIDPDLAARARNDFEEDLKQSVRVRYDEWKARPLMQKLLERFSYCVLARADVFIARLEMARKMR